MKSLNENYVPAQVEEAVLKHWQNEKVFEKSVSQRPSAKSFSFYDGPPFITGLPHYGHLLGSVVKDVIPRYQTMKGYRVERVWGWDCHGLPAENKVEKELGINSKKEIEKLGVDKFVAACKAYVNNVSEEWEWYINHIGRWVDFKNAYRTMDKDYMESVLWVFKSLYERKLIYKGKRVSLFCPRCSTPISNFEVAMDNSYKEVTDPSVWVKFKLQESDDYLLAWTTTPWTLPANFALAVNPKLVYAKVNFQGQFLVVAKNAVKNIFGDGITISETIPGAKLVGLAYEPLYSYFGSNDNDHKIYPGDFVSAEDGTGVVHIAPGFGEDDTNLGKNFGLTMTEAVDEEGHLSEKVLVAPGKYFKAADKLIIADLQQRGLLFKEDKISHSYPHCHRCATPLLYKAQEAWYIDVQSLKNQLLKTNEDINWVPKHFKHGRFEQGVIGAPDWCISRTRYWGAPIPVWECSKCDWRLVAGSIKEIEEMSGSKIKDLHRPEIDEVVIKCPQCGSEARRVREVLDSWVEAASMPYAERHYPFENEEEFKKNFPADFITEYTGQLRAWFYVMHVISNALYQRNCFKNVIVTGVIMGNDGRKMSKNYGNYPDPKESLLKYGADALRLYLMGSPIVMGEDISISENEWQEQLRATINILWNSYKFFANNAAVDRFDHVGRYPESENPLDQWILSRLTQTTDLVDGNLGGYHIPKAVEALKSFVNDLSTWYIRRSRERVGPSAPDKTDKIETYQTMGFVFETLFKLTAPVIPFIADYLYRHLTDNTSVHLQDWPGQDHKINKKLMEDMSLVRKICEQGHSQRKLAAIPVRQPLREIVVTTSNRLDLGLLSIISEELNVGTVKIKKNKDFSVQLDTKLTPGLIAQGKVRELIRNIQQLRKEADCKLDELITVEAPDWPEEYQTEIMKKALVKDLRKGPSLQIVRK